MSHPAAPRPALASRGRATRTTIFLKMLMAVSGLIGVSFLLVHMYGNLKAFGGERKFNHYAEYLRELGEPLLPHTGFLWITRIGLIAALVIHVYAAVILWRRASKARSTKYVVKRRSGSTIASRTMRWGGVSMLLFIIWHLLNFTVGKVNVSGGPTNNPYQLLVGSFSTWWLTLIYLAAMATLGAHLHHGIWSAAQTLGLTNTASARTRAKRTALATAIVISTGFSVVPIAVFAGIIA